MLKNILKLKMRKIKMFENNKIEHEKIIKGKILIFSKTTNL